MGSAEETTHPAKPPPPKSAAPPPSTAPPPTTTPPSSSQEPPAVSLPPTPSYSYYPGATAPSFFSPPVWGSQHLISPYGTPIPYSPVYPHPVYAHPSIVAAAGYPVAEPVISNNKSKEGGKVTSGSADDYGSQSGGESGSEGSSDTGDNNGETQDAARKRSFGDAFVEGDNSQPVAARLSNGTTAESSYSGRQRTVSKLPVSAPGRATLPSPATNLNIGMDVWNASNVGTAPVKVRANPANVSSLTVGTNGVIPEHQWTQDERELKRERRKQSNRESARRSRLRKQQECEDLARKVNELNGENGALKIELEQLNKVCKDLEAENASIMEMLNRMVKTGGVSEFNSIDSNPTNTTTVGNKDASQVAPNLVGSNGKI